MVENKTTLYLLRHGQTVDNVNRIIQGQNDSPLTREGIIATKNRAKKLKGIVLDAVFCSDLRRARKSLEILLRELNVNVNVNYCTDIRELDFGQLTGRKIDDVKEIIMFHKNHTWKFYPEGESGDTFRKRVIDFVERILRKYNGKTSLFMTHYGVIESILRHYIEKSDNRLSVNNYDIGSLSFNSKGVRFKWI
ncbi:MAG: histidine phosphatase family protein [Candidatus Scalinduaceae bacterium]